MKDGWIDYIEGDLRNFKDNEIDLAIILNNKMIRLTNDKTCVTIHHEHLALYFIERLN